MKLTNMANSPREMKEEKAEISGDYPRNKYPWGLCLNLDDDQCKALGINRALPPGTIVQLEAKAVVESATEAVDRDADEGGSEVCLRIQITDLGLEPQGTEPHPAELLYTNS